MIVPDSLHEIAMRFVKIAPHDRASGGDVKAAIVEQSDPHVVLAQPGDLGKPRDPACIDLHDAKVFRTIDIPVDDPDGPTFNKLDRRQHTRRQMIEGSDSGHAGQQRYAHDRGFTLLELLVVIVILGLLIGLVGPAVLRQLGSARASVARESIQRLESVLDLYRLDVGDYPSTEQGLDALIERPSQVASWNGPYLQGDKLPLDPWSHPYEYRNPSTRSNHEYDLCSPGPGGGTGTQNMICNP